MDQMKRVIKPEGIGNVEIEEVPVPEVSGSQLLVRTYTSLISAGSEIGGRYLKQEQVDPLRMGYSVTGEVVRVGDQVQSFRPGDRVNVTAPHAEFVVADETADVIGSVRKLPESVSYEAGTFGGLATSALRWVRTFRVRLDEDVVILGQGLIGSLILQTLHHRSRPRRLIAVDALPLRCDKARRLGADHVLNVDRDDVAKEIKSLTEGTGADLVVDAVGGNAGVKSFEMAQELVKPGGRLGLVGLYHRQPLSITSGFLMSRQVFGANFEARSWSPGDRAIGLEHIAKGVIQPDEMVTHRFPFDRAKEAFDLIYNRPQDAMCTVLLWPPVLQDEDNLRRESS